MSITSSAGDGIRLTSAAKESAGNAAVLGSPASSAADNVIVPDAITANNEGNLETSPTYVGRLIVLRPWEVRLTHAEPAAGAGGAGYKVGDVLQVDGGVLGNDSLRPTVTVTAVSGTSTSPQNQVTAVEVTQAEAFEIRGGAMTSAPSPPGCVGNTAASTTIISSPIGGTGCTLRCFYEPHYEIRYITADNSNTLTVHEPWEVPPKSGDQWAVGYIPEDMATVNGLTLRAQSGVFEATRSITVGPSTAGTRRGLLAMTDGKQIELDNSTVNFTLPDQGAFLIGYLSGNVPVNGAYISTSGTSGSQMSMAANGLYRLFDWQARSPREQLIVDGVNLTGEHYFGIAIGNIIRGSKIFDWGGVSSTEGFPVSGLRIRDLTLQGGESGTQTGIEPFVVENNDVDGLTVLGLTNNAGGGFFRDSAGSDPIDSFKNVIFVGCDKLVAVVAGQTWRFTNPVWNPDLTAQVDFQFASTTGEIIEDMSLIIRPIDSTGANVPDIVGYVYEGQLNDNLPTQNRDTARQVTVVPDISTALPIERVDYTFFDYIDSGDTAYFTNVQTNSYTPDQSTSPHSVAQAARGSFAFRGYLYGYSPISLPFQKTLTQGIDTPVFVTADSALTKTTASSALTLSPEPVVTRHHPDVANVSPQVFTDNVRMLAFNYDGGSGTIPSVGDTITDTTASPNATGVVADIVGDNVSGTLLLETWNEVDFLDNDSIQDGGGWTALVNRNQSPEFYETYTWLVDAQSHTVNDLYDYLAAKMAEDPVSAVFEAVIVWGATDNAATQLMYSGANGFYTNTADRPKALSESLATYRYLSRIEDQDGTDDRLEVWSAVVAGPGSPADFTKTGGGAVNVDTAGVLQLDITNSPRLQPALYALQEHIRSFSDDQYVQFSVSNTSATSGGLWGGVVRASSGAAYFGGNYNGDQIIGYISDVTDPSTLEVLATLPSGHGYVPGDNLRLSAKGTVLTLSVRLSTDTSQENFTQILFATDTRLTSGQPGWYSYIDSPLYISATLIAGEVSGEGVWVTNRGAGDYDYFTSDSGQIFTIPVTLTITLTGLKDNSEVRVCFAGTETEVAGVENTGSPGEFQFNIDAGVAVDIVIHSLGYEHIRLSNLTFSENSSIPISQRIDRNYSNP